MKIQHGRTHYELPLDLRQKLLAFRQRVWSTKFAEGVFLAVVLIASTFLISFAADRLTETPAALRWLLLLAGLAGWFILLPMKLYRWIWNQRRLDQLARLMSQDQPRIGDRLLGVIELVQ